MNVEPFQIGNYKFIKLVKTDRLVLKDQCRGAEMIYRFIFSYFALVELGKYTINYLQAVQSCTCSFSSMWIYCHPLIRQLDLFLVWYDQFLLLMVLMTSFKRNVLNCVLVFCLKKVETVLYSSLCLITYHDQKLNCFLLKFVQLLKNLLNGMIGKVSLN